MTNLYEYLELEIPSLRKILCALGADEKYIGEHASDYERLRELCKHMPQMSGHRLYKKITDTVKDIMHSDCELNEATSEVLWRAYYKDTSIPYKEHFCELVLKYAHRNELINTVDFSRVTRFVRPDKYHAELARKKEEQTEDEKNMLAIQSLRDFAAERGTATINAGRCDVKIIEEAVKYLHLSKIKCNLLVIFDSPDYLKSIDTIDLLSFENVMLGAFIDKHERKTSSLGDIMFIGRTALIFCDEASTFKKDIMDTLRAWQENGLCPEKCSVLLEKNQIFTCQAIDKS